MGIPIGDVRVNTVDTDYSPYEWQTVASRLTWSMGNAILRAADEAKTQIIQMVAEVWKENPQDLDIIDGNVVSYATEESIPLKNIVVYGMQKPDGTWVGGPVVGKGRFMPTYVTPLNAETGQGPRAVVHFTTGAQACEVEIDEETGEIQVVKLVSAYDVGKAINPDMVRTQMEGGAVQGLSTALLESLILKNGKPMNPQLHRLPDRHDHRHAGRDGEHHRRSAARRRPLRRTRHRRARHGADCAGNRQRRAQRDRSRDRIRCRLRARRFGRG